MCSRGVAITSDNDEVGDIPGPVVDTPNDELLAD